MKNIAVTGATGFIGSNLCRHLVSAGYHVYAIVRPDSSGKIPCLAQDNIDYIVWNSDEPKDCLKGRAIDCVVHLAALFIAEHADVSQAGALIDANIKFATQVLEAMRQAGVRRFINTGTSWQHFHGESYNPVCLYAATKEAFEKIIRYYVETDGLQAVTLELFDVYGPHDRRKKLFYLLNQSAHSGSVLKMSKGEQMLDLVHVDDVADAYLEALKLFSDGMPMKKYAVSSGEAVMLRDLVALYCECTSKRVNVEWGAREYRAREVMTLWRGFEPLPGWDPRISLKDGLAMLADEQGNVYV